MTQIINLIIWLFFTVHGQFSLGYGTANVAHEHYDHITNHVVECESEWVVDAVNPNSGALGLAQFLPSTWQNVSSRTGLTDWTSPLHQGYNAAVWASLVDPAGSGGWKGCWY